MDELTPRETRIADLAAIGFRNAEIAGRLGITSAVVQSDLGEIYRKLRVASRDELSKRWRGKSEGKSGDFPGCSPGAVRPSVGGMTANETSAGLVHEACCAADIAYARILETQAVVHERGS
jgi:DNA-binding CsgD family transcriptional regulator